MCYSSCFVVTTTLLDVLADGRVRCASCAALRMMCCFAVILSGFWVLVCACTMCAAVLCKGARGVACCGCAALHGQRQERSVSTNCTMCTNFRISDEPRLELFASSRPADAMMICCLLFCHACCIARCTMSCVLCGVQGRLCLAPLCYILSLALSFCWLLLSTWSGGPGHRRQCPIGLHP